MTEEEFAAIADDIKANGLVEPIILLDDKILDGIHRLKACLQSGVLPRYQKWEGEGGTPIQYVWSRNWTRRHLTSSQRAVISLSAEKAFSAESARGRPRKAEKDGTIAIISGTARDRAAEVVGVSSRYIQDAKLLKNTSPALLEEVRLGRMTLPAAKRQAAKATEKPNKENPTHRVRVEVTGISLQSEKLPKAEATRFFNDLSKRLSTDKDISVHLVGKVEKEGKATSNMYADTDSWNPFKGCKFDCAYCKPSFQAQAKRQKHNCEACYQYTPHEHPDRLTKIPRSKIVFVCGNSDLSFAKPAYIRRIIEAVRNHQGKQMQTFYFQSKEPLCLAPFLKMLPVDKSVLVTTLETNRNEGYEKVSKAPPPLERFQQFLALDYPRKVVTIEPVMDFDVDEFAKWIIRINPEYVWLGYNSRNANVKLTEPSPEKLREFAKLLVAGGIEVRGKHLRGLEMPASVKRYQD